MFSFLTQSTFNTVVLCFLNTPLSTDRFTFFHNRYPIKKVSGQGSKETPEFHSDTLTTGLQTTLRNAQIKERRNQPDQKRQQPVQKANNHIYQVNPFHLSVCLCDLLKKPRHKSAPKTETERTRTTTREVLRPRPWEIFQEFVRLFGLTTVRKVRHVTNLQRGPGQEGHLPPMGVYRSRDIVNCSLRLG